MIDRRDLLIGAGCLSALSGAEVLRPRHKVDLVGSLTLAGIIPTTLGNWVLDPGSEPILPPTEGSLADRLYDEILSRSYLRSSNPSQASIMLLCTRGSVQSDALQLHRPETCYPALGFSVEARTLISPELLPGVRVPAVRLTARSGARVEDILYWTRIGYDFPQTASDQRRDRLLAAAHGIVGDGLLLRLSAIRMDGRPQHNSVLGFARTLAGAIDSRHRRAMFGKLAG